MTAPRIDPSRRALPSRPATDDRPALRVVPVPRRGAGTVVAVATGLLFATLLGTAALHTMLASGQRDLDRTESQIRVSAQRNQGLRLQVAQMEAPGRIVGEARMAGMVIPDEVIWLTERADGTVEATTAPRATAPVPTTEPADDGAAPDADAAAEPDADVAADPDAAADADGAADGAIDPDGAIDADPAPDAAIETEDAAEPSDPAGDAGTG